MNGELQLALADVAAAAREGLLAMSVAMGLRVMTELMEDELTAKVDVKHAKLPGRTARRHTGADSSVGAERSQGADPPAACADA